MSDSNLKRIKRASNQLIKDPLVRNVVPPCAGPDEIRQLCAVLMNHADTIADIQVASSSPD
jgi:hypothetical protein